MPVSTTRSSVCPRRYSGNHDTGGRLSSPVTCDWAAYWRSSSRCSMPLPRSGKWSRLVAAACHRRLAHREISRSDYSLMTIPSSKICFYGNSDRGVCRVRHTKSPDLLGFRKEQDCRLHHGAFPKERANENGARGRRLLRGVEGISRRGERSLRAGGD